MKSGLAISVTRSLYFSRIRSVSATSVASSLRVFLFHMPRSSIHSMPNSREATSQKAAEILAEFVVDYCDFEMESSYGQPQLFLEILLVRRCSFFGTVGVIGHSVQFDNRPATEIYFAQSFKDGGYVHQSTS